MFSFYSKLITKLSNKILKLIIYQQIYWAIFLTCETEKINFYYINQQFIEYVFNYNISYYKTYKDFLNFVYNYNLNLLKVFINILVKEDWNDPKTPYQKILLSIFFPFTSYFFTNDIGLNSIKKTFRIIYAVLFGRAVYIPIYKYNWYNYIFLYKKNFTFYATQIYPIINNFKYYFFYSYHLLKNIIIPVLVSIIFIILLIDYFSINFLKQIAVWIVVGLLFFWLMSGFNFFIKRYRFGKFTSAIQRFWKRTNSYFWLIEGFLFTLFFYYYLNSSQEVLYMFDEANLNQKHLLSINAFYLSLILLIYLIVYSYYILQNLPNYNYKQLLTHLTIITVVIIYIFLIECYQFYYILTFFFENSWTFDEDNNLWVISIDTPKIRLKQQYFLLALIAKYWHFLFIFFSWLFLVIKSYEQKKINYNLFSLNLQNLLLLLLLNTLFITNWIKWLFRRFADVSYYWFMTDYNNWAIHYYLYEMYTLLINF